MAPEDVVVPDTKDWTWVLERPCAECGFDAAGVTTADLAPALRASGQDWVEVLRRPDVRRRPAPGVWSPLEYGCHVRDVHRTMRARVLLVLEQDRPTFADWDQDATALAWDRPGLRSGGSRFTVASLGRYHLHDVVHHLRDVAAR